MEEEEVLLDRFVFRRDGGAKPFPANETTAGSSTCIGVPFRVSVDLAAPPAISRFYLEWPRGPKPEAGPATCHIVAAHGGRVLFRLTSIVKSRTTCPQYLLYPDDYFVYAPAAASLTRLPTWTRPDADPPAREEKKEADPVRGTEDKAQADESEYDSDSAPAEEMAPTEEMLWAERLIRQEHEKEMSLGVDVDQEQEVVRSSLVVEYVGLVGDGDRDAFAVAELRLFIRSTGRLGVSAELSLFRSNGGQGHQWELKRPLPIDCRNRRRDAAGLRRFSKQAVVPFGRRLCWVDYRRGIIVLGDDALEQMSHQSPKLSYHPFPPVAAPTGPEVDMHRGVCATDGGSSLKLVDVVVNELPRRTTFTISIYTLTNAAEAGGMRWDEDAVAPMTAEELWGLEAPAPVPHEVPLFPVVSMDKPHVVRFLLSECTDYVDTVTLVTVDMNARAVLSVHLYIKGEQELHGEDADLAQARSSLLQPFIPAEFSKSLVNRTSRNRKRKIQE